ncbi:hypothetical protein JYB87_04310 [Shewanella avicenniae]|uniref:Uncharacterized protein n=1 Tax=Shewanella avicenniae TaxID=2814294 RepID=A0ABX7QU10_9GAMM|nr:hypothetical protein [Shewanella avicenniae]QSX34480.1 hypothetical protein JYB87_04310 [Shewanella avicenniae]
MNYPEPQDQSSRWWLWPLLPFAAFIGAGIGAFLLTLFQWFGLKMQGGFSEDGWYFLYILPIISSAAFGWLFAYITLYLAPKGKVIAASVLVAILGAFSVFGLLFMWLSPQREVAEAVQATISSVATVSAAIATIVTQKNEFE